MLSSFYRWDKLRLREEKCGQLRNGPQKDQVLSPEPECDLIWKRVFADVIKG